jgi:hypothetical protein
VRSERATKQTLGLVSLSCSILAPFLLFLPFTLYPEEGENAAGFILLAPLAAIAAILTGWPSGRRAGDPLSGRIGLVLGILEVFAMALIVLFFVLAQDALNEPL